MLPHETFFYYSGHGQKTVDEKSDLLWGISGAALIKMFIVTLWDILF